MDGGWEWSWSWRREKQRSRITVESNYLEKVETWAKTSESAVSATKRCLIKIKCYSGLHMTPKKILQKNRWAVL